MARSGKPPEPLATSRGREGELAALIARIAEGDQTALAALYDATSPLVHSLALRILRDPGAAEDVTMDVYMQAYRYAASYDAGRGTPSAWLLTFARSRAIDRLRAEAQRQKREESLESAGPIAAVADEHADPEESSSVAERGRLARSALAALTPEQRQAIEVAYFSGLSHREIAAKLGQPLGTVKTRIRTGMMRLRDLLGPLLAEGRP